MVTRLHGKMGRDSASGFRDFCFLFRMTLRRTILALKLVVAFTGFCAARASGTNGPTMSQVLTNSKPSDWRSLDPENTLYLDLGMGRVVIELAADFATQHVANVRALAREHYFDGLAIIRAQDNYVVQWGDPNADKPALKRKLKQAKATLPAESEFDLPMDPRIPFTKLPD